MFKVPNAPPSKHHQSSLKRERSSSSSPTTSTTKKAKLSSSPNEDLTLQLKKTIKQLTQQSEINLERRNKYPTDPNQWLESELKIDESLKQMQDLSLHNSLYPQMVQLELIPVLSQLLSHENVDVVLDVIDLLIEFTEFDDDDENDENKRIEMMNPMLDAIFECEVLQILVSLLNEENRRLNRFKQSLILQIIENLHRWDAQRTIRATILPESKTKFCEWIMSEISMDDQNKSAKNWDELHAYVFEILAVMAATELDNDESHRITIGQHTETMLNTMNYFRKNKPRSMDEEEMVHNLFDCLCSCLMTRETQDLLRLLEGLELLILVTRESSKMRHAAIKAISFALLNNRENCVKFMDIGGHATLFAVFMKIGAQEKKQKGKGKKKESTNKKKEMESQELNDQLEEHIISILVSLFIHTTDQDQYFNTLIKKFSENQFEKTSVLMSLFRKYYTRVYLFDHRVESGAWDRDYGFLGMDEEQREALIYSERLKEGLFLVQRMCIIIAFLHGDSSIREQLLSKLSELQVNIATVHAILQDAGYGDEDEEGDDEASKRLNNIVKLLVSA